MLVSLLTNVFADHQSQGILAPAEEGVAAAGLAGQKVGLGVVI